MKRIRKNDTVIVTTGKSKGHVGIVLKVLDDYLIVQGANLQKKHIKPNPQASQPGEIKSIEARIHASNVAIYNVSEEKKDKVVFKFNVVDGENVKTRSFKSNGQPIVNENKESK